MSRLDRHVARAQARMALLIFVDALGVAAAVVLGLALVGLLLERATGWSAPHAGEVFAVLAAAGVMAAGAAAMWRRPSLQDAAVAIDEHLGLRERFSSALLLRGQSDRFAVAAVWDAEAMARKVIVPAAQMFPLRWPRGLSVSAGTGVLLVMALMLPQGDLLGRTQRQEQAQRSADAKVKTAQATLNKALAAVQALPAPLQKVEAIQIAKANLAKQVASTVDPESAKRTAASALADVEKAIDEQVQANAKFVEAQKEKEDLKQLAAHPLADDSPLASVQQAMAQGDMSKATADLEKVVENFDKLDKKEQEQVSADMQKLAAQLQNMAQSPAAQQQMERQLQQMGMSQQQAQQARQMIQQAAAGNRAAQQQLQQMAKQAMSQMNPASAQRLQQMMNRMQAQTGSQQRSAQMAQAAHQLAQAMRQQTGGQKQQQQNQGPQPSQAQGNKLQAQMQGLGLQAGQQQSQGGQPQQQGGQPQQQSGQQQGMNQAGQAMADAMQQMQAIQQDAQQMQAAQDAMSQSQQDAMNGLQPGGGEGEGEQGQGGGEADAGQQGGGNGQGNQPGGGGHGFGAHGTVSPAPYTVKKEFSPSQTNEKGRLLASTLVKAGALLGEKRETLKNVAEAAEQDAPDEIDEDHISRQAQGVVKEYFRSMQDDASAGVAAPPTTQPGK